MAKAIKSASGISVKRAELLAIAESLGIYDSDIMSTKALKRAIKESQESQPTEPLPGAIDNDEVPDELGAMLDDILSLPPVPAPPADNRPAPAAEAPARKKPAKEKPQPLTSVGLQARLDKARQTIGELEGMPKAGGAWESPAAKGHIVLGSFVRDGKLYVRTVRLSDGREFTAQTKRIVSNIRKQAGIAGATISPVS